MGEMENVFFQKVEFKELTFKAEFIVFLLLINKVVETYFPSALLHLYHKKNDKKERKTKNSAKNVSIFKKSDMLIVMDPWTTKKFLS